MVQEGVRQGSLSVRGWLCPRVVSTCPHPPASLCSPVPGSQVWKLRLGCCMSFQDENQQASQAGLCLGLWALTKEGTALLGGVGLARLGGPSCGWQPLAVTPLPSTAPQLRHDLPAEPCPPRHSLASSRKPSRAASPWSQQETEREGGPRSRAGSQRGSPGALTHPWALCVLPAPGSVALGS